MYAVGQGQAAHRVVRSDVIVVVRGHKHLIHKLVFSIHILLCKSHKWEIPI